MSGVELFDEELFEQRLRDFKPEPLFTPIKTKDEPLEIPVVIEGANAIDLAKVNYLNFLNHAEIKKASEDQIREYGVGTCGPRGFFGSTDVHLEGEEYLAKFLKMEESILYSYGFSAISSPIPAYCKRKDVIFVDEYANIAIQQGLTLSRSKVVKFTHNNPDDFRKKVREVTEKEKTESKKYLIIEGISWNTGKLCPLLEFLKVAEEFKLRIFLEESYSLGVIGATGRGLTEYYNVDSSRIDMIFGTLEGALGTIGGFCAGRSSTIEHQRLSGSGYIFSASAPTYMVRILLKGLELVGHKPQRFAELTKQFHTFLEKVCKLNVVSHPEAPFKLISIEPRNNEKKVHQYCRKKGVHFIHNENGLVINLNVALLDDKEKLKRVYQVFKEASDLIN